MRTLKHKFKACNIDHKYIEYQMYILYKSVYVEVLALTKKSDPLEFCNQQIVQGK